ncbi:MAG TPA: adenylate/guanylate cyclase domain-containing protein, partial [Candidatus Limnocylindrales bacterium]
MTAVCPSCGASVPAGARFCATCGAGLAGTCPRCGTEVPDGARFCPSCGHQQAPLSETVEVRRIATILFADVVGSTALGERLDPERLRAVLADHFAAMTDVIATWGGSIEKFIGDAIMAAFGVSAVREDDARRALSAALEMMGRLATLNARLDERHGVTLALRIGVNTGEVIAPVGERVEQLIVAGDAVNIAARLQAVAEPGTILVGDRTWLATRDAFRFG